MGRERQSKQYTAAVLSGKLLKSALTIICLFITSILLSQSICPANINFSFSNLTHWQAYTGNNLEGNGPSAIKQVYDSSIAAPTGTIGASFIPEYQLTGINGISVITTPGTDVFGGFSTIPTINGYSYTTSVLLGSTTIQTSPGNNQLLGGYIRGLSYLINVPPGSTADPYTVTYAYAMVLENGNHTNNNQPIFTVTIDTTSSSNSKYECVSAAYRLPTKFAGLQPRIDGTQDSVFSMDENAARALGFSFSNVPSPNENGNQGESRMRVWTKDWSEVTLDLASFRGKQVAITFEADNCVPGGHFSYAYIALRSSCDGITLSGPDMACINSATTYSIPALTNATYNWQVPTGWSIVSGANTNIIRVVPSLTAAPGNIRVQAKNECNDLRAILPVSFNPPTDPGDLTVLGSDRVCEGINNSQLEITGYRGTIINWLSSTNGASWNIIPGTVGNTTFSPQNLTTTTLYKVLVQNGNSCTIDSSSNATIVVDATTRPGNIAPDNMNFCLGQNRDATLTLINKSGAVLIWQSSTDGTNWNDFNPPIDTAYNIPPGTNQSTQYRAVVQNGVCPMDISIPANVTVIPIPYPQQIISPVDTLVCYEDTAHLRSLVTIGTSYAWTSSGTLSGPFSGAIPSTPALLTSEAFPLTSSSYTLKITNNGCPNILTDTFQVNVQPRINAFAGNDTSIVIGQPLLLNGRGGDIYEWSPGTGLNDPSIRNPTALLNDNITYSLKVSSLEGCFNYDTINIRVFKTSPDIFVPNAFTPGKQTNRFFRPIPAGISVLHFFRVYNRWGQLVYNSTDINRGWDGTINGKLQDAGTYVWMVKGTDFTGKVINKKGTMVLIR